MLICACFVYMCGSSEQETEYELDDAIEAGAATVQTHPWSSERVKRIYSVSYTLWARVCVVCALLNKQITPFRCERHLQNRVCVSMRV